MSFTVEHIAKELGATAAGDLSLCLTGPAQPEMAGPDQLALAMTPEFSARLTEGKARVAILPDGADWQAFGLQAAIFAPRPRYVLSGINRLFAPAISAPPGIHPTALVSEDARIGKNASIGAFVVIEAGVVIGENARILSHVSIAADAQIGADCLLYQGVRICARVQIGARFLAQPNAVIGADGFSFVSPEPGAVDAARLGEQPKAGQFEEVGYARTNSLGSVTILDDVEVGAGSTIDRGTIADTVIGTGTKIDNMVHVGHNVQVGAHCLLCAQVGIGGSVVISDRVVLAGQVGVADHVTIGTNVVAAGKSGISSNVPPNRFIMGNPAIKAEANVESYKAYRRLPRLVAKVEELQKQVSKLRGND
ncbi:MAG: UDP-3-O-(3-hydroxymyristoyl)glucosamine N-acyltransferase [Rhodobacteraceae bacterium]|nr:UDP-3-O-(3-hydroxymyristoyl)glucosamine N-acyltransferase [Paracoccaceae bacterium]